MRHCGKALPKPPCACCDGYCGPTTGCACVKCMVTELNLRKLPYGWLLNNQVDFHSLQKFVIYYHVIIIGVLKYFLPSILPSLL